MNPESFANYQLKVYNPGSPYPDPEIKPLDQLPRFTSIDPDNPLKLTITSKRKHSTDCSSPSGEVNEDIESESATKKPRGMNKDEMKLMFQEFREEYKKEMTEHRSQSQNDLKEFQKMFTQTMVSEQAKFQADVNSKVESMQTQLSQVVKEQNSSSYRLQILEERFADMTNSTSVRQLPSTSSLSHASDYTWKSNLAKEISDHEHCLIIHGMRLDSNGESGKLTAIKTFLKYI